MEKYYKEMEIALVRANIEKEIEDEEVPIVIFRHDLVAGNLLGENF